jgi:hypothetical protein
MGLAGIWLSRNTGFPKIWDENVTNRQRFLIPVVAGIIYGLLTVMPLLFNQINRDALSDDIHVKFPFSVLFYTYSAIFLETFLKRFLQTLVVFIISNIICRGKFQVAAFWIAAVLISLYEPLPYIYAGFTGKSRNRSNRADSDTFGRLAFRLKSRFCISFSQIRFSCAARNETDTSFDLAHYLRRIGLVVQFGL